MTPDNDQSCNLLERLLLNSVPFIHAKFGDGAIDGYYGRVGKDWRTTDGEGVPQGDGEVQRINTWMFDTLRKASLKQTVYLGDWMTCGDPQGLFGDWTLMLGEGESEFRLVAYEALHLHRTSEALLSFYMVCRQLACRKMVLTSWQHQKAQQILGAEGSWIPGPTEYDPKNAVEIAKRAATIILAKHPAPEVLFLMGGGIAAMTQAFLLERGAAFTMISLGSALDPLTLGRKTRSAQIVPELAREYFGALL